MDDAVIRGQLGQIFPHLDVNVIQRIIEEAKASDGEAVDILTLCIELVLDRQANVNNGRQQSDEVIVVKSIKKERLSDVETRDIPLVYVPEDNFSCHSIGFQPDARPRLFSDYESDSEISVHSSSEIESGDDVERVSYDFKPIFREHQPIEVHTYYNNQNEFRKKVYHASGNESPVSTIFHETQMLGTPVKPTISLTKVQTAHPSLNLCEQMLLTPEITFNLPPQHSTITEQPCMSAPPNSTASRKSASSTALVGSSLLDFVKQMFPQANMDFVKNLSQQGHDLNVIVNTLFERPDMRNFCSGKPQPKPSLTEAAQTKTINYFKEYSKEISPLYFDQCLALLKNEFRRVSVIDIKRALQLCNGHYAPGRKLLEEALLALNENPSEQSKSNSTSSSTKLKVLRISRLLANKRSCGYIDKVLDNELQLEVDFVKAQAILKEEEKDAIYAAHINEQQYKDEGQQIECGCCFGEFAFEEVVQCSDGHLFCKECLHGYAKEIIFGSSIASVNLTCMGEDCNKPFPYSQLEKCLTKDEIEKYQSRLQEDCLAKADIPNLHQCPFCEFAAIVPENEKVFSCLNPKCGKESCKECQEAWKDHFGLKCSEVEKKSQTNLRRSYEERMTMAKVRKCTKCPLTFTKLDGCNKMTCRCGTTQCYVCRKSCINYGHFCRHPRDPGKKCSKCTACSLWTDPTEDDELAIKQLQEEATVAKRKLDEEIKLAAKKQKV